MPRRRNHNTNTEQMLANCRHCAELYVRAESTIEGVCPTCAEERYFECAECGRMHHDSVEVITNTGRRICRTCAESTCFYCAGCETHYENSTDHITDHSGNHICEGCWHDYERCVDCGEYFYHEDMERIEGGRACFGCVSARNNTGSVMSYRYKPTPIFHRTEEEAKNALVLGIELEMDKGDSEEAIARISSKYAHDWLYFKYDGSLSSGTELVTHPISPAVHMSKEGRNMWSHICKSASAAGMKSHDTDTCGLHIHVNRDYFGKSDRARLLTEYKLCSLVDRFYRPLEIFSRRKRRNIEQWARRPELPRTDGNWLSKARAAHSLCCGNRYYAVNITNDHTIEFRLFRGTLKPETLFATFALVAGLCAYAKNATPGQIERITWYDLCYEILRLCPAGAPELENYLIEKELIVKGA